MSALSDALAAMDKATPGPCLRCGSSKTRLEYFSRDDDCENGCRIICENGHAWDEWLDTEEEAIAAWNEKPGIHLDALLAEAKGEKNGK